MKEVLLYTDGACIGNPGAGGYAAILKFGAAEKTIVGGEASTTNNRMELMGVIAGLSALNEPCSVIVCSDSAYVVNAFEMGWVYGWMRSGWRTADKKDVKNVELWQQLVRLCGVHLVRFNKVKGHADDEMNNRCDSLARAEADRIDALQRREVPDITQESQEIATPPWDSDEEQISFLPPEND